MKLIVQNGKLKDREQSLLDKSCFSTAISFECSTSKSLLNT